MMEKGDGGAGQASGGGRKGWKRSKGHTTQRPARLVLPVLVPWTSRTGEMFTASRRARGTRIENERSLPRKRYQTIQHPCQHRRTDQDLRLWRLGRTHQLYSEYLCRYEHVYERGSFYSTLLFLLPLFLHYGQSIIRHYPRNVMVKRTLALISTDTDHTARAHPRRSIHHQIRRLVPRHLAHRDRHGPLPVPRRGRFSL